ncbi:F-actin-capping protein subunit alpha [Arctopsyche grandis]|uniref:F-actin-capping protein subunit alpha n=1 Tax=Arctopsyche grandis TaxID=121162 RepID=UPI00406D9099
MAAGEEEAALADKVRIVSDFILHSPPGEFNEVFNDVRVLLANDGLLREGAAAACARYNRDQLTPARLPGAPAAALVTDHNELPHGRFYCPRARLAFRYDHLRREATDVEPWAPEPGGAEAAAEGARAALDQELASYSADHYRHGASAVFGLRPSSATTTTTTTTSEPASVHNTTTSLALVACIEDHHFQPKNYWNGRWRSVWSAALEPGGGELRGVLKVQVHYYEDGNVQLVSSKEVVVPLAGAHFGTAGGEAAQARDLVRLIAAAESAYQEAISDNYKTMSDTTFKALRRQLPVTRTKIDWTRIVSYSIGKELKSQ